MMAKTRTSMWLKSACLATTFTLTLALMAPAAVLVDDETQDIIYLSDGRVLNGQIVSETSDEIIFLYLNAELRIETRMTLKKYNVSKIDRDVPVESPAADDVVDPEVSQQGENSSSSISVGEEKMMTAMKKEYGISFAGNDPSLPSVYIAPMRGQMGTDIHNQIYKEIVEDITEKTPDLIVWILNSADTDTHALYDRSDQADRGMFMLEEYRDLVNLLKDDKVLKRIPQLIWVQDSSGISSVIALAWSDMYMAPEGRLDGLSQIFAVAAGWSDADIRAKMIAAWVGVGNGFLEEGGYPLELGEAMMNPTHLLSASWVGRDVKWTLNGGGEYLVDRFVNRSAGFSAKDAEDFRISDGTAENFDDLMLLHGFREYRLSGSSGYKLILDYIEDWRRAFDQAQDLAVDINDDYRLATGRLAIRYLGKARTDLKRMLGLFVRYNAVEIRMGSDLGWDRFSMEVQIEEIGDQLRALRRGNRAGGGGGGADDGPRGTGGG